MSSFERVKAAIHFSNPDKVPIINYSKSNSDIFPLITLHSKDWKPGHAKDEIGLFPHSDYLNWERPEWAKDPKYNNWKEQPREEIDEWGCIWNRVGTSATMGHPGRPSLPEWSKLDDYIDRYFPNAEDKSKYSTFSKMSKAVKGKKYIMALLGPNGPLAVAMNMRGFTNFLMDTRRNLEKVKILIEHITEYYVKSMKMWVKSGGKPDGFFIYDDLGMQDRSYFKPELFKGLCEPLYHTLYETAHSLGCEFHHHCCGKIDAILPFLIEWGLDAIEFDSPRMTGYHNLKPFREKIMMWACLNIQSIYTKSTPEECTREVWHMIRNLGTPDGGFGAYFYPQVEHLEVPKENIRAFKDGIKKYGNYPNIPSHWWDYPVVEEWKDDIVPPLPPLNP